MNKLSHSLNVQITHCSDFYNQTNWLKHKPNIVSDSFLFLKMFSILILGPDKSNCFQRHLKKLNGQQIDHNIFLKFLDMISLAMNYHLVNKLIYIYYLLCIISYIFLIELFF